MKLKDLLKHISNQYFVQVEEWFSTVVKDRPQKLEEILPQSILDQKVGLISRIEIDSRAQLVICISIIGEKDAKKEEADEGCPF